MTDQTNYSRFTAVIMGKSGSGKDTAGRLLEARGYERIVTHTSRPMRTGEAEGVSYHFHTQDEFERLRGEGYFAESRNYDAAFGHCSYGASKESLQARGRKYIIVTPEGYQSLLAAGISGMVPVYLRTDPSELTRRLTSRLGNETDEAKRQVLSDEIGRRLESDRRDFMEIEAAAAGIGSGFESLITINTDTLSPDEVAAEIDHSIQNLFIGRLRDKASREGRYTCYDSSGYDVRSIPTGPGIRMVAAYTDGDMTASLYIKDGRPVASVYRLDAGLVESGSEGYATTPLYMTKPSKDEMSADEVREFLSGCIDRYREISSNHDREAPARDMECECL